MICQQSVFNLFGIWMLLHCLVHLIGNAIWKTEGQFYTIACIFAVDIIYSSLWVLLLNHFSKACTIGTLNLICQKQVYVMFFLLFGLHMILHAVGWAIFKMEDQYIVVGALAIFDISFMLCFQLLLNLFKGVCPV